MAAAATAVALAASTVGAAAPSVLQLVPLAVQAPDTALATSDTNLACTFPATPAQYTQALGYSSYHCYTPQDIRSAYAVDQVSQRGAGQTIVLVDAYGSPTAKQDLQYFHDTFFGDLPDPNFDQVYPLGAPDYSNANPNGSGLSGPAAAANWSGEATLDIEWAYSIAPLAHIVLLAVPPAETLGVQGFPNLFRAISGAIDTYPAGTVFSMSFGVTEQTFGGAAAQQTARFDAIMAKGNAKGDSFFSSSGDNGTTGAAKQQKESASYPYPTVGWPTSSPQVTSVGGTQLQSGWTWDPSSNISFNGVYKDGALVGITPNPAYFAATSGGFTEAVWNESWLPAATGGGPSAVYSRPSWQSSVADRITDTNGTPVNARGIPDLSWDAAVNGGVLVYITAFPTYQRAGWHVYGGTSSSSPQVAALVALANESQHANGLPYLGNVAPLLYSMSAGQRASAFRDIVPVTEGTATAGELKDNSLWNWNGPDQADTPGSIPGHPTTTGWDETTGFGSPLAPGFIAALSAVRGAS